MQGDQLLNQVDIEKIANEGEKIYAKIKHEYEPHTNDKYLAIEVNSGKVYYGETSFEAVEKAKMKHPNKVFYIVKIGFKAVETLARGIFINNVPAISIPEIKEVQKINQMSYTKP